MNSVEVRTELIEALRLDLVGPDNRHAFANELLPESPSRAETKKLMPAKVAFDAGGKPTPALQKRLEKEGVSLEQAAARIERKTDAGVENVYLNLAIPGVSLAHGLQSALEKTLAKLPIPKVMGYQLADGTTTVSVDGTWRASVTPTP